MGKETPHSGEIPGWVSHISQGIDASYDALCVGALLRLVPPVSSSYGGELIDVMDYRWIICAYHPRSRRMFHVCVTL